MDVSKSRYDIHDLLQLMQRLRDRENGCPWDIEQDFQTIKPHTIEEAYEVADAIERGDMDDLKDELGDLLFQVVFHTQMAAEQSAFVFEDVVDHVTRKMIYRHPHVFGDTKAHTADDVKNRIWEEQKAKEKQEKQEETRKYYLDSVTLALPSLLLAQKIQKAARRAGFKYPNINAVLDKLDEELCELDEAVAKDDKAHMQEEYGDVLFVAALIGRHMDIDAEEALRKANLKFIGRFNALEDILAKKGLRLGQADIRQLETAWQEAKVAKTKAA